MHADTKDERVRLRVSSQLLERARKWADRHDESLSAYFRGAVRQRMNEDLLNDIDTELND